MKILLITTSYPDADEGQAAAGIFVRDFARALVEAGHETAVMAPSTQDRCNSDLGVREFRFAVPHLPLSTISIKKPWSILQTLYSGNRCLRHICRELGSVDHVLALWALPSGYWARKACKQCARTYSIWTLGSDVWSLGKVPLVRQYLRLVLKDSDYLFSDGLQLLRDTESIAMRRGHYLSSSRRLDVPRLIRKPTGAARYCFIGRWHPNKGADLLMDALLSLSDQDWELIEHIDFAGGGPLEVKIRDGFEQLMSCGRPVSLHGYVDQQQAAEMMLKSHYQIIPSRIESIPVIFSDALQCNCRLLCSPVGDLPELLRQNDLGLVADSVSAAAIKTIIQKASQTPWIPPEAGLLTRFSVSGSIETFISLVSEKNG